MSRVTVYLPDDLEVRVRKAAEADGKSASRWIVECVSRKLNERWHKAVLDAAGIAPDFPTVEEIRGASNTHG